MTELRRIVLAGLMPFAAAACDYMALSFDGSLGLVVITVSDGHPQSPGGYRIRTRQAGAPERIVAVAPGKDLEIQTAGAEPIELTLLAPPDCRVVGPNPQLVTPASGHTVQASFQIECGSASDAAAR